MSTTTHPFTPEEVMAFVDGELSADRTQSLSAHLDQCAECHEAAAALRTTLHALSQWRVDPLDSLSQQGLLEAASSNCASDIPSQVQGWLRRLQLLFSRPLPWAFACLLFAFLIGAQLLHQARPSRDSIFAKYKVSPTVPPQPAGPSVANQDYSRSTGGGSGGGDYYSFRSNEVSGGTPVDRAALSQQTGHVGGRSAQPAPMIARTVALSIVVNDFDTSRTSLDAILARHNGYAAGLNVATPQGAARALQASLRIPAPQLVAAVAELKALGRVESETQNGEEVTQQHADLLTRLKNSRETELRLQDVLRNRTGKVKDVLEVEEEIARVRGEIEQMEAEQQTLEHRVNFATIDLKLAEEYKAQLTTPAPSVAIQLRNAIVDGFRSAFESLLALVLFLAESGPTLLLWLMILSFPAWLLCRRYRRSLAMGTSL
ncbi:MAG TPA: DUF4349 domain-containing protein [Candidatus Acidoferrum sp.]|nr:DUF4349 domain-containing protein [Candidatus Acidoferrum sp.]